MLGTEISVFLFQEVNIHIHVIFQFISHIHIKSELSLHLEQNPTTVTHKETYDYSSFSDIIFTKNHLILNFHIFPEPLFLIFTRYIRVYMQFLLIKL